MEIVTIKTDIKKVVFEELTQQEQQLVESAKEATKGSYSPYSHYAVGAAVRLENGVVLQGSNQENAAYPSGLCAERVTMFYANARYSEVAPEALAIAIFANGDFTVEPGTPCGACRQVLLEVEQRYKKDIKIYLYGRGFVYIINSVKDLLPLCFTSDYLNSGK